MYEKVEGDEVNAICNNLIHFCNMHSQSTKITINKRMNDKNKGCNLSHGSVIKGEPCLGVVYIMDHEAVPCFS